MLHLALIKGSNFYHAMLVVETGDAIHSSIVSFSADTLGLSIDRVGAHLGALVAPCLVLLILSCHARLLFMLDFLKNVNRSDSGKL